MKTLQEVFNIVSKHLLKQNKRCMSGSRCVYRGDEGMKCAIGALIKDEHFDEAHNLSSVYDDQIQDMLRKSGINTSSSDIFFMRKLQDVHDDTTPNNWEKELKKIAKAHNLIHTT